MLRDIKYLGFTEVNVCLEIHVSLLALVLSKFHATRDLKRVYTGLKTLFYQIRVQI